MILQWGDLFGKRTAWSLLYFLTMPILIFSPGANFGHHPLSVGHSVFTCHGILVSSRFQKYLHILMNLILLGLLALSLKLFSSHDLALRIACISKECTKSKVPSAVRKKMLHKFPKKYPNSSFGKFEYILK